MKRFLAIALALTLMLTATAALNGQPAIAQGEKTKFSATFLQNDWHGLPDDMEVLKKLEEMANVEVDWQVYDNSTWSEKKQLILAGGDLPDVFYMNALNDTDVVQYSAQGALIELSGLIDQYCPRLSAVFAEMPNYKAVCTDQDSGLIYKIARAAERDVQYTSPIDYINTDWLEKFNLETPKTTEEFENALRVMVNGDANGNGKADEIGYSFHGNLDKWDLGYSHTNLFAPFGLVFDSSYVIRDENGEITFIANQEEYKNALIWIHHMVEEGLFDIEGLTSVNTTVLNAKGNSAEPVLCAFTAFDETFVVPVERYESYDVIGALEGPTGEIHNLRHAASNGNINGRQFVMTVAAKGKEEAIMTWLDCHFDPTTSIELFLGPVGTTLYETETGMLDYVATPEGMSYSEFRYGNSPVHVPCVIREADWGVTIQTMTEDFNKLAVSKEFYRPYADQANLFALWNSEETDYIANEGLDLKTYCNQMHVKWIVEGGIEEDWDSYCAQLEKLNWEKYLATYENMYNRLNG